MARSHNTYTARKNDKPFRRSSTFVVCVKGAAIHGLKRACLAYISFMTFFFLDLTFTPAVIAQDIDKVFVRKTPDPTGTTYGRHRKRRTAPKAPKPVKGELQDPELQEAIMALILNGQGRDDIQVLLRRNDVWASVSRLKEEGVMSLNGPRKTLKGVEYVSLASLAPDLTFELDIANLELRVSTQKLAGGAHVIDLKDTSRPKDLVYARDTSAFLNYSLQALDTHLSSFNELGFSWKGHLAYSTLSVRDDGHVVRGLSNITIDNPKNMQRLIAGDSFSSNGILGSSVLLGGFKFSRQFTLDPYFVRFPSFGMSGAAVAPSTVDVYVNGRLVSSTQVNPGSFDVQNIPAVLGAGNAQVMVRDVFGRQQQLASPYYFSTGVLKKGLDEYNFSAGARRKNISTDSFNYGGPALQANYRLGFTDYFTAGMRSEFSDTLANGGPTATFRLPIGEAEFSLAGSYDGGRSGLAGALGYTYISKVFSAGALARLQSNHYANLMLDAKLNRSTIETNIFGAVPITSRASATLQYTLASYRDGQKRDRLGVLGRVQIDERTNVIATAAIQRIDTHKTFEGLVSLVYYFGDRTTGSVTHSQSNLNINENFQVQRPLALDPGLGYRVDVQRGDVNRAFAMGQYQTEFGLYEASVDRTGSQTHSRLAASGGVVFIDGDLFLTRPVYDSYALIQVPKTRGVRGYLNNMEIGDTNNSGNLLVPNLISYYGNRLSINDKDVPLTRKLGKVEHVLAPPYRGGVVARFDADLIQAITGKVVVMKGEEKVIPTYGELSITVDGKEIVSPLGEKGEFYLEDVPTGRSYRARIVHEAMQCEFSLKVVNKNKEQPIVDIGTRKCTLPATGILTPTNVASSAATN